MAENRSGREPGVAEAPPHYHGHRERLRERFREAGSGAVTDYELLELVLFRALPRRDVKPLAKSLIARFGSFGEVIAAPWPRLAEVDGLGDAAITELKVVEAAALRLARGEVKRRHVLSSWTAVLDYCRTAMAFAEREQLNATSSSSTRSSRSALSTIRRSIRAKSSNGRWNCRRPPLSWSTTIPPAIRLRRVPMSR
jgi:hypothetical protein